MAQQVEEIPLPAYPNLFGGVSCPKCSTEILTPKGMVLIPGVGHCVICGAPFLVTDEAALLANANRRLLRFIAARIF